MEKDETKKNATTEVVQEQEQHHQYCEEERKIEKFFAIIKRLREARDSIARPLDEHELAGGDKEAKKARIHGSVTVWTPVFELEDFDGLRKYDNAGTTATCSLRNGNGERKEEEKEEKGLDLNLTL